jgi:hypothetical protein
MQACSARMGRLLIIRAEVRNFHAKIAVQIGRCSSYFKIDYRSVLHAKEAAGPECHVMHAQFRVFVVHQVSRDCTVNPDLGEQFASESLCWVRHSRQVQIEFLNLATWGIDQNFHRIGEFALRRGVDFVVGLIGFGLDKASVSTKRTCHQIVHLNCFGRNVCGERNGNGG